MNRVRPGQHAAGTAATAGAAATAGTASKAETAVDTQPAAGGVGHHSKDHTTAGKPA